MKKAAKNEVFFDTHPVLAPWPKLLRQSGLKYLYKPREVFWAKQVAQLNLRPGEKVLEVGCGRGVFLDRLAGEYGVEGWGVDVSPISIAEAKKEAVHSLHVEVADAAKLPYRSEEFDAVVSFDVLEHVENQPQAVAEMVRVLRPGGCLLIYTINARQRWTWNWWLGKIGIDVFSGVDHRREKLVDPAWLGKKLEKHRITSPAVAYFNAFFSLVMDELVTLFLAGWERFFGWEKRLGFGRVVLGVFTAVSRLVTPGMMRLEKTWYQKGYSNSFSVWGIKK